jgi:hypothetical protein
LRGDECDLWSHVRHGRSIRVRHRAHHDSENGEGRLSAWLRGSTGDLFVAPVAPNPPEWVSYPVCLCHGAMDVAASTEAEVATVDTIVSQTRAS